MWYTIRVLLICIAMINPYQPPESAPANRTHDCPVCGGPVGFWRFVFPLGYCEHCRNYLTIRHWDRKPWIWSITVIGIIVIPNILRSYRYITFTPPIGTLLILWFAASIVHSKLYGRLVPAYCWGFFAVQNDDRIIAEDG
ncbi:hypothetical protein RBSH_04138 [Rhodopirellula baltica SH28]|uniref:DUF983 domain-containing protein n=3 Tax=Rhodopirellula baltica TaxID=265606 RepID=F2ASN7_RHOBT|nr:conserved hypothetical protein, membrane [Rhodopirellula baltica WH47]EKK00411.1 hypothetical protein RBSH_04138 [Rhodopirellula baltica SH28]